MRLRAAAESMSSVEVLLGCFRCRRYGRLGGRAAPNRRTTPQRNLTETVLSSPRRPPIPAPFTDLWDRTPGNLLITICPNRPKSNELPHFNGMRALVVVLPLMPLQTQANLPATLLLFLYLRTVAASNQGYSHVCTTKRLECARIRLT